MPTEVPSFLQQPPPRDPALIRAYVSSARQGVFTKAIALAALAAFAGLGLSTVGSRAIDPVLLVVAVLVVLILAAVFAAVSWQTKKQVTQVLQTGVLCKARVREELVGSRVRRIAVELQTANGTRNGILDLPAMAKGQFEQNTETSAMISETHFVFFAPVNGEAPVPYPGLLV